MNHHHLRPLVALLATAGCASSALAYDCTNVPQWTAQAIFTNGMLAKDANKAYQAKWWTQNNPPATNSGQWDVWKPLGDCDGTPPVNQAPVASYTGSASGLTLSVNGSGSSDPDGTIASYAWNFGDGSTATGATASRTYAAAGTYTVVLTVTDNRGATATRSQSFTVNATANQPPVASFTGSASGLTLSVNGSGSSDPDGTIASYAWNFGDGATATGATASRTYAAAGTYTVALTVTDNRGATNVRSQSFTVSAGANQPPTVAMTAPANNSTATTGQNLTLSANAADADGTVAKVQFFVNGGLVAEDATAPFSTVWTARAGVNDIVARATDDKGATRDSAAVRVTVSGTQPGGDERCRPEGLVTSPGTAPAYCKVYDEQGREKMGADKPRRIIGYFTSWRTGKDGTPAYLASQIPWAQLTHINYAFAHIENNKLSVGNTSDPNNAATGLSWPGVAGAELDPALSYKGHFNLLTKYKKQYPLVKTMISVGGWAETGGYFGADGKRVASGGFYTMTTNADGSVNQAGINTFADSAVAFLRQYGFDGVDIDYEYATSMKDAGNPDDFAISNARRAGLNQSFHALMKTLRARLDAAGQADAKHYLLTVAAPSSAYLLRGMEAYQSTQYLDYVNIMSYDLHGAWNQFVGPNAALYDDGKDAELIAWNYYSTAQYQRIGYLNTDWAYHYFRGSMPAGRINIGVPYYTRGFKEVSGGNMGLWGQAAQPDQSKCPAGTGGGTVQKCGNGAVGLDNLWHDSDASGREVPAGSNPLWHAMNLADGRSGSYITAYGLTPATDPEDQLVGTYTRQYDAALVAPWLWNATKRVFLSTETEQSLGVKAQYVADRGIGGVMFWELAGDYGWNAAKNEYFIGNTLTNLLYNRFKTAAPYANKVSGTAPAETLDIGYSLTGFALGDSNYPINPKLTLTNNSTVTIPGGADFGFDVPTAIPDTIADQSGFGLKVVTSGANPGGGNVGGLKNDVHRVAFKLPSWQTLAPGASVVIALNYQLPMTLPSNWVVSFGGKSYGLKQEARRSDLAATQSPAQAAAAKAATKK